MQNSSGHVTIERQNAATPADKVLHQRRQQKVPRKLVAPAYVVLGGDQQGAGLVVLSHPDTATETHTSFKHSPIFIIHKGSYCNARRFVSRAYKNIFECHSSYLNYCSSSELAALPLYRRGCILDTRFDTFSGSPVMILYMSRTKPRRIKKVI